MVECPLSGAGKPLSVWVPLLSTDVANYEVRPIFAG